MSRLQIDQAHWSGLLKRLARCRCGCGDEEDLLHSAFLRLVSYRENHAVDNPNEFLMRTAINLGIDAYRQERFCERSGLILNYDRADDAPLQDEVLAAQARLKRVRQGLERLPPRTREILLMHRLEGRRYKEIAAHFGISRSAVEKHVARAMLFLSDWTRGW